MANLRIKYKRARRECVRLKRMLDFVADAGWQVEVSPQSGRQGEPLQAARRVPGDEGPLGAEVSRLDVRRELEAARREADKLCMELADTSRALRAAKLENGRICRILDGMRRHPVGRLVYAAIERKGGFWDGEG